MTKLFRGLTPRQALEAAASRPKLPRLINKNYQYVRSLFLWAAAHDYVTQNPATVLRDVNEGRAQDARKALDDDDIEKFIGFVSQHATEAYELWIPSIMAFTGCRMGEAARLGSVLKLGTVQRTAGPRPQEAGADHLTGVVFYRDD
ncbi:MAG TPA: hypothetical protein VMR06_15865 [Dokdonella sp.]|uniref:hypothetical protein n=1 Tax=Dokdonella sp. TaxID=2291710 RepID=UPI002C15E878|nr:hypothetical protein [Dokdonella sp.]HUD43469.1 hypothetical protein [Dokdonella sp.]